MASANVTEDKVASSVSCGPDPEPIVQQIKEAVDAGIDHVYLHQVGDGQERFLRFWREEQQPSLAPFTSGPHR